MIPSTTNKVHSSDCSQTPFLRLFCSKKDALSVTISQIAKKKIYTEDFESKKDSILEALTSPLFSSLKKDLKTILKTLNPEQQQLLLNEAITIDLEKNEKIRGNRSLNLLKLKDLEAIAKEIQKDFTDTEALASELNQMYQIIKKHDVVSQQKALQKKGHTPLIFRMISNFFRTIAVAFNLLNLGKVPSSYFETKYMLDIYWMFLEVPIKAIKFIFTLFKNPLTSLLVTVVGATVSAIALTVLTKVLKRCPNELTEDCTNLTKAVKTGSRIPSFGREQDLETIIERLASNNDVARKHPLLVGETGIGKSTLMDALAWRLVHNDVPENLKGKKVFSVNAAILSEKMNSSPFALKDPLKQIVDKIGPFGKDIILIIDEAHNLNKSNIGERFKSLSDTTSSILPFIIGITTTSDLEKSFLENEKENKNALLRRFDKIQLEEPSRKQAIRMMRAATIRIAEDVEVSDENLGYIFDQSKEKIQGTQPDQSTNVLSLAIRQLRDIQAGKKYRASLYKNKEKLEAKVTELKAKTINAYSISSQKPLIQKIEHYKGKILRCENRIKKEKVKFERYIALITQRRWHQDFLSKTSEKIDQKKLKTKKITTDLKKIHLFNHFFLLPQLDLFIKSYKEQKNIKAALDTAIIDDVIQKIVSKETK